jgi:tetratricopeptide (TPR) repeat protein
MKTLSLCLVVQDIQTSLSHLLKDFEGLVDQICVVDVGLSEDSRQQLVAAGATLEPMDPTLPEWERDSRCLELAHCDWILRLRTDERPNAEMVQAIRDAVQDVNLGVGCATLRHLLSDNQALSTHASRLFRRDPQLKFTAAQPDDLSEPILAAAKQHSWQIFSLRGQIDCFGLTEHSDDGSEGQFVGRQRWQDRVDANPDDVYAWYRLLDEARLWDDSQLLADSAPLACQAMERLQPTALRELHYAGEWLCLIASGLYPEAHKPTLLFLYPEAPQEALDFLEPWTDKITPDAAFYLRLGELRELMGTAGLHAAAADFDRAIGLRNVTLKAHLATVRPLLGLARAALGLGDATDALRFLNLALGEAPRDPEALLALTTLSHSLGGAQGARQVVDAYLQTYGDAPELHGALGETALRAGDTQTAVSELQLAVGSLATASPYYHLLDEALLAAL